MSKKCPDEKELNPKTNRCRNKCIQDKIRNEISGNCVKPCKPTMTRDEKSGRCKNFTQEQLIQKLFILQSIISKTSTHTLENTKKKQQAKTEFEYIKNNFDIKHMVKNHEIFNRLFPKKIAKTITKDEIKDLNKVVKELKTKITYNYKS